MAVTLVEAAKLSQNLLYRGVVEEMLRVSPILQRVPFIDIVGNALQIPREDPLNMGNVGFVATGGVIVGSEAKFANPTYNLYELIGQADVPGLIQQTRSNIIDQMAAQVKIKSKLMAYEWEDRAIYGDHTVDAGFDGWHIMTVAGQMLHAGAGAVGGPITERLLDELFDIVKGGPPSCFVMNLQIRRRMAQYLRPLGSYRTERDDYGNYFGVWNETPILATEHLLQSETILGGAYALPTTGLCSSIFALRWGEGDGVCGIQNGGIQTEIFDKLEQYNASRTRLLWYTGQALYSTLAIGRIDGVTDAAMTA